MSYLETAGRIAREAGLMIQAKMGSGFAAEEKSSVFDVVTEVDRASEQLIRQRLEEAYPEHGFLGEEESFAHAGELADRLERAKSEPFVWIVDPIDGTNNYVQGIPGFTVSIALASYGELVAGVIYDPCRDEMFWAEKGEGAFMNGSPIAVSAAPELRLTVVGTGFPSKAANRQAVMESLRTIAPQCRSIRSLGSAALHLAYVAAGRLGAFWEYGLNAWDIAAGVLIIEEAGGKVTDTLGWPYSLTVSHVVGSNGKVHDDLLKPMIEIGI
ncbi:Inositol-1-monophosphatase [Paenibacillus konkukensis]|uniref:Inositol-1-monophosphatase n=1 Tax=Paenibacillus konkukensis TaxID=2020716 RepID=A0ABY4RMX0_9BACL|nr:inositol monophosphatase family protein [Paenibacillus konkukensis]UQZ83417.1 Inositol-1-monophosphatase [Paenibacillus konkukensis]